MFPGNVSWSAKTRCLIKREKMSILNIKHVRFLFLLVFSLSDPFHHIAFSQTKDQVLNLTWQGLGGKQSWDEARYFMFSCKTDLHTVVAGEHSYIWDRVSGDCRFEGINEHQEKLVVLFNTKNGNGRAFVNRVEITAKDSTQKLINPVMEAFSNDSFWLFLPSHLSNSSTLQIGETALIGNTRYYVVQLDIPATSLQISKSKLFIDTNTGKLFQWQAFSSNGVTLYNFQTSSFRDVGGGLTLATAFSDTQAGVSIHYPIVSALINVESDKFSKP